ncbi:hypothetical protein PSCICM_11010 [Pseudomonas cichorii]|uniref:Uncharacterized protein n=1 Tax=Pseudomonas cichorii TaxID=36746 RepID=A0ABQ1DRR1_PSECI|nr:hypothetical protein PSCICJ_01580 [Pseudomonas cichorii]GFM75282.1 hypothetical protein PSCICM_11010 [Pseudomonas cichorii]GFM93705.1 hypothetical protein PSCICP_36770 [Pseudomonas cichorii]
MAAQQLASRFKTSDARHLDIHQHDVRLEFPGFLQGLLARVSLTDNLQAIYVGKHAGDACADKIMVIDN